jgi:hypothetical protein
MANVIPLVRRDCKHNIWIYWLFIDNLCCAATSAPAFSRGTAVFGTLLVSNLNNARRGAQMPLSAPHADFATSLA